jgi:long-chain fatty acid transport protein
MDTTFIRFHASLLTLVLVSGSSTAMARPYAALSGLAASADSAATAGTNPAGIMRFDNTSQRVELLAFFSESTWEGQLGETEIGFKSDDSTETIVPSGYFVKPLSDKWGFSFTVLGAGFSDDLGEWPGRYVLETYDSVSISAFPSIAYRVNDKLSIAGSLSLTYSIYEQERRVANLLDPGFGDGKAELDTDGFDIGFGASMLYEINDRTRWGLTYLSEVDPELDGDTKYSGLGPNTEAILEKGGFLNADVEVKSRSPQSVLAGIYHEFENEHAVTMDVVWSDFSRFKLSEFYFDGETIAETDTEYQDIWAVSGSYSWPINSRWMMSVAGLYASSGVDDEDRSIILRLDELWGVGVEAEWQWTEHRNVLFGINYLTLGDAPVDAVDIPLLGSTQGKFTSRDIIMLRIGMTFGAL